MKKIKNINGMSGFDLAFGIIIRLTLIGIAAWAFFEAYIAVGLLTLILYQLLNIQHDIQQLIRRIS